MRVLKLFLIVVLVLGVFGLVSAEEAKRTATIASLRGTVEVRTPKSPWKPAQIGMVLNQGDIVRSLGGSFVVLNVDGSAQTATVELKENSQLRLSELLENKQEGKQTTLLDLALGEILIKAQKLDSEKSKFQVKTPTSIVGVRGTTFSVSVEAIE